MTYIHLIFDQHQLIYAEGAPSESFYPGPLALKALDRPVLDELLLLFPTLKKGVRSADPSKDYGVPVRDYLKRKDLGPRRAA